ncbi:XTP/dITP diphosphatase [Clostridium oryzae]|uniref:dITP/XTP pyrophosphatase n=1 Tax=Clostridium oryzae TaxID=1450648 RepID=A0A1V4IVU9_9CLOT|nr:XTP/dITP diphosphatase [Clostridium oryzae]OPJ64171.1 dITP/XTP pyrophosphatase [Clostridium oryzae]
MKNIIIASNNDHKVKEIKEILRELDFNIVSLKEAGIDIDVEETGSTFIENSRIKAEAIYNVLGDRKKDYMVMADDSGLSVDVLGGAPGVYSARYAGEHGNSKKNNDKLLSEMKDKSDRKARFVCSIVIIGAKDEPIEVEGYVEGVIAEQECGQDGFGYDPLFYVPEFKKTFAEMTSEEKNSISHRGNALKKVREELMKL